VKREATIAGLALEGLALISGSAGAGSSVVVGPTPTDPVEFCKCARDLKTLSAAQKHTNEERGGSRGPGVRRPGAGRGQLPARSKIFRAAFICGSLICLSSIFMNMDAGCAGRRQRHRQHEVKDRKMRVPLVSPSPYYLELTN